MFQIEFAKPIVNFDGDKNFLWPGSRLCKSNVELVLQAIWEEHCVECSAPDCYSTCSLYNKRLDGACKRFTSGIVPNFGFGGHYEFGADISFEKWAKLEIDLSRAFIRRVSDHELYDRSTYFPHKMAPFLGSPIENFDEFLIECFVVGRGNTKWIVEYFTENNRLRETRSRNSFNLKEGYNLVHIPFGNFNMQSLCGYVCIYPDGSDQHVRVIFSWLDFVKYKIKSADDDKGKKVKCVVWDLDNTLWRGILSEGDRVKINPVASRLVVSLDRMGILQTIVSKNDYSQAWEKIVAAGLEEYFLFPEINWEPKSLNIERISRKLNLSIDSFAVIDDSDFERREIKNAFADILVFDQSEMETLLDYPEFDVPFTEEAKVRRESYKTEIKREINKAKFSGSYEEFIVSCEMSVVAFIPTTERDILRCWELVQRSNQLNLTGAKYSKAEFRDHLNARSKVSIALKCSDKFGDYGIVGFSSFNFLKGMIILENLMVSCRVAQKKVEQTFLNSVLKLITQDGSVQFKVVITKTTRNFPIRNIFADFPFIKVNENEEQLVLEYNFTQPFFYPSLMRFEIDEAAVKRFRN